MSNLENLEDLIKKGWGESRKRAHNPCLPNPQIKDEVEGGAHFDFLNGKVRIGKKHIAEFTELGLKEDRTITGTFDHEIAHYMVFPKNLSTMILMGYFAEKIFKEKANPVFQLYADMVVDTHSVLKENTKDDVLTVRGATVKLLERQGSEPDKNIRLMNLAYLYRQANEDAGQLSKKINKNIASKLEEMMTIDFSRNANHEASLYKYGDLIKDLLDEPNSERGTYGSGSGAYKDIIKKTTKKQIEESLREIIKKVGKSKYEEIKKWIREIKEEKPEEVSRGIGVEASELGYDENTARYYSELSRAYPLVIVKVPRKTEKKKKVVSGTEKWRSDKDISLILPHSSFGKILPGITKSVQITEKPRKTLEYQEPNALILVDTSGSMPNPSNEKSYAALGSCIVARSYHARGNYVGGINFDAKASILPFTRNLDNLFLFLTAYKGGGTALDIKLLKEMLDIPEEFLEGTDSRTMKRYFETGVIPRRAIRKDVSLDTKVFEAFKDKKIDVYMFTDGDIQNQEEVLEYLSSLQNLNRASIILTGGERYSYQAYSDKVNITMLENESDMPKIAVKEMSRALGLKSEP